MFRHTALFPLRPETTAAERERMLRGLATLPSTCATIRAQELGASALEGDGGYHVALHLDFDDADGYAAYVADPGHRDVAAFNDSVSFGERIARVDWLHDGDASRDGVRHTALFAWTEGADRAEPLAAAAALPGARVAEDAGGDPRAWDWLVDLAFPDLEAARSFLEGDAYRAAMEAVFPAVVAGKTASITWVTQPR